MLLSRESIIMSRTAESTSSWNILGIFKSKFVKVDWSQRVFEYCQYLCIIIPNKNMNVWCILLSTIHRKLIIFLKYLHLIIEYITKFQYLFFLHIYNPCKSILWEFHHIILLSTQKFTWRHRTAAQRNLGLVVQNTR